ncbi:hypothetical protein AAY473_020198 [Plecturocebus cupreus]
MGFLISEGTSSPGIRKCDPQFGEEEERRPPARSGGQAGRGEGLRPSRRPGFPASLQGCGSLRRRSFRARGAGPRGQAVPAPGGSGPVSSRSRARPLQPRRGFPSPPPALSAPALRPASGSGSGRRRCRRWRTGDRPGAREGRKLEAAAQKSCEVASAGGRGSWSGDEEDPRGRSPPGTSGGGRQGPGALGGRGPGRCGALGPGLCAFPGTAYASCKLPHRHEVCFSGVIKSMGPGARKPTCEFHLQQALAVRCGMDGFVSVHLIFLVCKMEPIFNWGSAETAAIGRSAEGKATHADSITMQNFTIFMGGFDLKRLFRNNLTVGGFSFDVDFRD